MRSVLALAAVAAFAAWSGSADAFGGKKNRGCCGDSYASSCCGYGGYGGGYGCSYGHGYGGCSSVVYAQPVAQAAPAPAPAPAPAAVAAPAAPVYVAATYGCSGGYGYGCSGYGGWGCSGRNHCGYDYGCSGNDCCGRGHHKNKGRKCCR